MGYSVLALILMAGVFLQATPSAQATKSTVAQAASAPGKEADTDSALLLKVKRIYVESFGDDIISKELQSMIVSALVATKRFMVTENHERADAILKGVALEKTSQELHAYGESTAAGVTRLRIPRQSTTQSSLSGWLPPMVMCFGRAPKRAKAPNIRGQVQTLPTSV